MNNVELTEFQLGALAKFDGVRALTETGLARVLKCEKVVARYAITTLKNAGLIKSHGAYEFSLTPEGQLRLGGKSTPDPKAKREADKIPASGKTKFKVIEEKPALDEVAKTIAPEAVHSLPPAQEQPNETTIEYCIQHDLPVRVLYLAENNVHKPSELYTVGWTIDLIRVNCAPAMLGEAVSVFQPCLPAADVGEPIQFHKNTQRIRTANAPAEQVEAVAENLTPLVELNQEAPADFDTLVRRGLERLNHQLGLRAVKIHNLDLKVETLARLAESVGQVDKNVQDILFAIASDLHLFADRSS